jgi:protein gp37
LGCCVGKDTKIEWAHHTFNPWWGCVKVSPACNHCYAETFSRRIGYSETGKQFPIWGKDTERRVFGEKHWDLPYQWHKALEGTGRSERVFCGSMCDVMEDHPTAAAIRPELFRMIEETPCLNWLLLTKRPQNFRRFLPPYWLRNPRENVWLMTTVESQEFAWRVLELCKTPAHVRGLSIEPLLGPLDLTSIVTPTGAPFNALMWPGPHRIDWVIVGGESGPGARPMHPEWARSLRDKCHVGQVEFFFKQWGDWMPIFHGINPSENDPCCRIHDGFTFPKGELDKIGQHMWRVGKKAAGRLLDGKEWNEVPA